MLSQEQFKALASIEGDACVSFFTPTHRAGQGKEDRIRYKNMVGQVENALLKSGLNQPEVDKRLTEVKSKIEDNDFWLHQSDGLAVFIQDDGTTEFLTLPVDFEEIHFIGDRFYLRPLAPLMSGDRTFLLLAISQNEVKYYEGTRHSIAEIETNDHFPESLAHFLRYDVATEDLQHHSGSGTQEKAIYHGQGSGKDSDRDKLRAYLAAIDQGVMSLKCHDDTMPLLLAADRSILTLYPQVNQYPYLHQNHISGNPEREDPVLLHEKAWALMEEEVNKEITEIHDRYEAMATEGEASSDPGEIIPAAISGRVSHLFMDPHHEVWGTYDAKNHQVELHSTRRADSVPLLDRAVVATLRHGGNVFARPGFTTDQQPVQALFRYALESVTS